MIEQTSLREYQRTLSARLLSPQAADTATWLGVEAGGRRWLLDLADIGETLAPPDHYPVPLTQPWLTGVASIRGNLHTLVDLGAFAGGRAASPSEHSRVILLADRYRMHCGLLVDRILGLFRAAQFKNQDQPGETPAWLSAMRHADDATVWTRPDITQLIRLPQFLSIGLRT